MQPSAESAQNEVWNMVERADQGGQCAVRVVTYNVLSSKLAPPDHFIDCDPADLDADTRLLRLKEKLEAELQSGAIVALQEVSMDWCGPLAAHFHSRGYHFVYHLYGKPFNGYMGVGIAYPLNEYHTEVVDIVRIADVWPQGTTAANETPGSKRTGPGPWRRLLGPLQWLGGAVRGLAGGGRRPPLRFPVQTDEELALSRMNAMVSVKLRHRASLQSFTVGTYHMPCLFDRPWVMAAHAAQATNHAHRLAAGGPLVLLGDFNFKPRDPAYHLLTTGALPDASALDGAPPALREACAVPGALASAYAAKLGHEPDFTNYARTARDSEPFVDCLDYIFVSPGAWEVVDVLQTLHRNSVKGPFPVASEPSDHIMLAATLSPVTDR